MFEKMKFKHKIGLLPVLAGVAFASIFTANVILGSRNAKNLQRIETGYVPALQMSRDLQETLAATQRRMQDAVAAMDVDLLDEADELRTQFLDRIAEGDSNVVLNVTELETIKESFSTYYDVARSTSEQMMAEASDSGIAAEGLVSMLETMRQEYVGIRELLDQNTKQSQLGMTAAFTAARASQKTSVLVVAGVTIVSILLLGLLSFWIIRGVNRPLTLASSEARAIAQQIVAAVKQQSVSSSETATSVSETSTTVGEIRQTSDLAAERAKAVAEIAEKSIASSESTREAISQGIEAMRNIREEVEGIAKNILDLSQKNIQIGEIVQTVNAIAEQSNLLAVNASIEAAKAGEQGKGFSVVAGEVKALAGQSKDATNQIRAILSEVQKSSNAAVMVTEQGVKRVEEGSSLIEELGEAIADSSQVIEESADAAKQISMTANQQLAGLKQIEDAIKGMEMATKNNASSFQQLERAAEHVKSVSDRMVAIVEGARNES